MKIHQVSGPPSAPLARALAEFEEPFTYPLGPGKSFHITHGEDYTRLQILLYTVLLTLITVLPYLTGLSGLPYLVGALLLDAGFLYYALALYYKASRPLAIRTFSYSIVYLMLLFAVLLGDRYLPMLRTLIA